MPTDLSDSGRHALDNSGMMRAMALQAVGLPGGAGPHWIDARLLCKAAAQRAATQAQRQGVVVKLSTPQDAAVVIGFAPMLLKALELVIANALHAMRDGGGTLTLRVYRDPYVVIECIDTGAAARADQGLDHMTRSWRREEIAPRPSAGVDARLDAAREIIVAHRGCLWHRPSGGGASVNFELPAAGGGGSRQPWRGGTARR
jgi:signal transduction histidine kinase